MISYLSGKVKFLGGNYVVLLIGGIGYKVFVCANFLEAMKENAEIGIYVHQHIRENAQEFYGFETREELDLFEKLISISGIGPKSGIGILAVADVAEIKRAIIDGNSSLFTKVSGIGSKTAERLLLEMRDKIDDLPSYSEYKTRKPSAIGTSADAIDALKNLGYSESEARDMLRGVDAGLTVAEKVRQALSTKH
ncbi:MAG: hypothetical protein ACD_63C00254G0001 [uncultured bacterium]|nr:MAG: hypothetical protein ACD_63C00254G0001 [uncultured bacterium]